jgi:DNA polymerase-3 subunit alpha
MNEISCNISKKMGIEPLLIRHALYVPGQADAQEIMTAISENQRITDGWFRSRFNRDVHPMNVGETIGEMRLVIEHLRRRGVASPVGLFQDAARNTVKFANLVTYKWTKQKPSLPQMAPDEYVAVRAACVDGWVKRFDQPVFGHKPTPQELQDVYKPRLAYELSILKKLGFSGYFLLVQDIVQFAKTNGILVGPGRGSVGGSLVAYLMGITDCDPIRFGLLFERFINPDRLDLPDADLDFMSERRHEIVEYLIGKYGNKRVAGVSNFGTLAAASAIRDVGRVTGIPERDYSVSKLVPKLHGANVPLPECRDQVPEIAAFASTYEGLWPVMETLEGTIRNFSQHAAGLVVGGCDLVERAVVEDRKGSAVVCWDKRIVEEQGLIKVDILGLKTLDIIKLACDYIRERHGKAPDLNRIDLTDKNVLDRFALGKTTGVFQFESGGMRRLLKELGSDGNITFDDITACTALYRPGPMESGMMDSFYLRKQGNESIEYDHPNMIPVLKDTFGVMVYQEQVMQVSRVIAGYSGAEADKLRKIMGKKLPEEMKKERGKFVDGCVKTIACDPDWAGALFDKIEGFAGYGFNKSHSVEYTLISYQCMWLKTNFPVEFYAAALTVMDEDKLPSLLREAKMEGIVVETPSINSSTGRFEIITDTRLSMPFQRIKGLSSKTVEAILDARAAGPFLSKADFLTRVEKRRCNIKHQDCLEKVGAFAWLELSTPRPDDPCRIKDQIELLPGLITASVPISHDFNRDKLTKEAIADVVDAYRARTREEEGTAIKPHFGKKARFMIISDCPGNEEDGSGLMGLSRSNNAVMEAMLEVGIDMSDVYWTALVKRPKRGKQVTPEEIALYADDLKQEIEITRPPIIVLLGSQTVRHFIPGFKGKASDSAAKIIHMPDLDANVVIGFSPGEIWHDPDKQTAMNEVFEAVATMLT